MRIRYRRDKVRDKKLKTDLKKIEIGTSRKVIRDLKE